MKFCKYCGKQILDGTKQCDYCGKRLDSSNKFDQLVESKDKKKSKKILIILGIIVFLVGTVIGIVVLLHTGRCKYSGCNNKTVPGSDYCYNHKCSVSDCNNCQTSYSNFCYSHHLLYDDNDDDSYKKPSNAPVYDWDLRITVTNVYTKYNYTYAEGTLRNDGDSTVKFVTLKGAFKTYSGDTIDTDTTYAVGSEGLAPGESTKWKMSVTKDDRITSCEVTVTKYDY